MTVHDATRTCATLLMDLEAPAGDHAGPASRRRVDGVADVCRCSCRWRRAKRCAGWGSPFDEKVNSRLRCCTGRILLRYWQQERPSPILVRASDLQKHWSG